MARWRFPAPLVLWINALAQPLHARVAGRLLPLFSGLLFAQGRRTVASWLRAARLGGKFRLYYYFLRSLGRKVQWVALALLRLSVTVIVPGERLLFALDDTPTKRAGPKVQGAGIHHNPTPGPSGQKFLYGHVWVTVVWVVRHALWGAIGLPLRALLYVRRQDVPKIPRRYQVAFRTKLDMAAELLAWLAQWLRWLGKKLWLVADGAYAKRPVLRAARTAQVTVVSRLRKDAALRSVPKPPRPHARKRLGRPLTYGKERISLAKRAGHQRGWQSGEFLLYGKRVTKTFKTFPATYKPAGGLIRVVIVREPDGWRAYFCTDAEASVAQILEAVSDRAAVEQDFHDIKEVHGAGQQQVRDYWANVAVYHLNLWWHTLIELWAWDQPQRCLCNRKQSPWDDASRRPSHADRRNSLRRQCVESEFQQGRARTPIARKFRDLFRRLLGLIT